MFDFHRHAEYWIVIWCPTSASIERNHEESLLRRPVKTAAVLGPALLSVLLLGVPGNRILIFAQRQQSMHSGFKIPVIITSLHM